MEQFTVKEWITIISPLILVFIAGYLGLRNQRKSIKLQAKNKWKEDFRLHVSEYIEIFLKCIFHALEFEKNRKKKNPNEEKFHVFAQASSSLVASFSKIKLMLDLEDEDSKELIELSQGQNGLLGSIIAEKSKNQDFEISVEEFSKVAKRIYDKKK